MIDMNPIYPLAEQRQALNELATKWIHIAGQAQTAADVMEALGVAGEAMQLAALPAGVMTAAMP